MGVGRFVSTIQESGGVKKDPSTHYVRRLQAEEQFLFFKYIMSWEGSPTKAQTVERSHGSKTAGLCCVWRNVGQRTSCHWFIALFYIDKSIDTG